MKPPQHARPARIPHVAKKAWIHDAIRQAHFVRVPIIRKAIEDVKTLLEPWMCRSDPGRILDLLVTFVEESTFRVEGHYSYLSRVQVEGLIAAYDIRGA